LASPPERKTDLLKTKFINQLLTDGHMLSERDFASLFDELVGLHSVVKIELDFFQTFEHALFVIDCF